MPEPACPEGEALLAELALGVAEARDRADALCHVERCARCRRRLAELSEVADTLSLLAPPAEAPAGFAASVLAATGTAAPPATSPPAALPRRWHRPGRRARLVAASLLVAALAAGGGWLAGSRGASPPAGRGPGAAGGPHLVSAALEAGGAVLGEVVVSAGRSPWISMALHDRAASGLVACKLRTSSGALVPVGSMWLSGGKGWWAGPLRLQRRIVVGATVTSSTGVVLASASFAPISIRAS